MYCCHPLAIIDYELQQNKKKRGSEEDRLVIYMLGSSFFMIEYNRNVKRNQILRSMCLKSSETKSRLKYDCRALIVCHLKSFHAYLDDIKGKVALQTVCISIHTSKTVGNSKQFDSGPTECQTLGDNRSIFSTESEWNENSRLKDYSTGS